MRYSIMALTSGAFEEIRLPAFSDADYQSCLSAKRLGLKKDITLKLEVLSGIWKIMETEEYTLSIAKERRSSFEIEDGLVVMLNTKGTSVALIVVGLPDGLDCFEKYNIAAASCIRIGKQPGCEICYDFRGYLSKLHVVLQREGTAMRLHDKSTNGVFLNGKRVKGSKLLAFGDSINILGLKLIYLGESLAIWSGGRPIEVDTTVLRPYKQPEIAEGNAACEEETCFKRAPRIVTELHHEPVEIEGPPPPNRPKKQPLLLTIGPAFTMMIPMLLGSGMAIISTNASGGRASAFMYTGIITAVSAACIGVMWALINLRHSKKQIKEDEQLRFNTYKDYLIKIADKLRGQYKENAALLNDRYPSTEDCLEYGLDSTRLWNRNLTHSDFLFVRLGMGGVPFQVPIQVPKERFTLIDDSLAEKPRQILENFQTLQNVPVGVDLREHMLWGVYGNKSMDEGLKVARNMAIQIAANNCYTDVKLVFLYEEKYEAEMSFAKWLPHVWSEDRKVRYIATNKNEVGDVLYALGSVLRIRAEKESKEVPKPHYVVFVCNPDILQDEPAAKFLLEPIPNLGVSTVLIADEYEALPNTCTNFIQRDNQFNGTYDVQTMEAKKRPVDFDDVGAEQAEQFARWLSGLKVNELENGGEIPNAITFFDMHQVKSLAQFNVIDRWRKNKTYENMRALVGQKTGGTNLYLDIHEKYHGPHGLVAGTTGSGKSETLQTYMLSLALNFSPLDVGFFVIDYKGGGMANLFSDLPHMLGQISNLSGNQVRRAMVSIKSEIKRRQRIFGEYDVNHLDQYTRLLKNGEATAPIPHLVIVIDEFAELKREEPDFMRELISVAQVGRSLGIHLILATQKPAGTVDDNIWSNSKFKLCLRVQDRQDSMDMLKRPDAAYITQAGRCYFQVGNDEIFELFQSGWSGAAYDEDYLNAKADIATMISITGQPSLVGNRSRLKLKEQKRTYWLETVMDCIMQAAEESGQSIIGLLQDETEKSKVIGLAIEHLHQKGFDYPASQYNVRRMTDFADTIAELGVEAGTETKPMLPAIQRKAALMGKKLPELKEKTQLAAIVEYLNEQAFKSGLKTNLALWLPVLPERLYLQELAGFAQNRFNVNWPMEKRDGEWELAATVGLCDDPVNQAQTPVNINFATDGNVAVCGMVVSGKSTFLQTLLYSLVNRYSPETVNFYILDYNSRMLGNFGKLKHCGGVVFEDQPDRTSKLFVMLNRELERRKKLFQGGNYAQYIRANGLKEPALLLVIDGFANFKEKTDNRYEDTLIALSREGANYGIYLVIAAGGFGMSEIQNRIGENIKTVFCLQMGDKLKYADTLRTRVEVIPEADITGRGLALVNGTPLEFQTALAMPADNDYQRIELMQTVFERMNAAFDGKAAKQIPEIPSNPTWELFEQNPDYTQLINSVDRLPIGYVQEDASLYSIDLRRAFTYTVLGQMRSGKTNVLCGIMQAAHDRNGEIIIVDGAGGDLQQMAEKLGAKYVKTEDEMVEFANELYQEMAKRNELKRELRKQGATNDKVYDEMLQYKAKFIFINDVSEFMQQLYGESQEMKNIRGFMENFLDKGEAHNMYVFGCVAQESYKDSIGYRAFNTMVGRKTGILLGGNLDRQQLFDFSSLPYSEQVKKEKPGIAMVPANHEHDRPVKVVIPKAKGQD